jgi:CDGSH-type Zn-finger protein
MPRIACRPNGPYLVEDLPPGALAREDGSTSATGHIVGLCRCGGSKKKPFCDGTHSTNGFSDANIADRSRDRRVAYAGKGITIFDNRGICSHAGHCTDRLKNVFRMNAEPWIDPDAAAVDQVIATIGKCPSGALSYALGGMEKQMPARPPMVTVTNDGPYAVSGGIELADVRFGEGASREHYALCRCGGSKNKPFCDGTHWHIGFKDP